jgi:hypothetical protein
LLARDANEVDTIVRRYRDERSLDDALQLVLDTLLALKRDLQAGRVSADEGAVVIGGLQKLLRGLAGEAPAADKPVLLMGAPGRDPLDAVVLELVRVLLRDEPLTLEVLSTDLMSGEALAAVDKKAPAAVIVPSIPPAGLTSARQLCMRLHARVPELPIVAARLGDPESEFADRAEVLEAAGCTEVAASLSTLKSVVQRIVRATLRSPPMQPAFAAAGRSG